MHIVGAIFAFLAAMECLTPLPASPIYTYVYNSTLSTFPGAIYLISAGFFVVVFGIFL